MFFDGRRALVKGDVAAAVSMSAHPADCVKLRRVPMQAVVDQPRPRLHREHLAENNLARGPDVERNMLTALESNGGLGDLRATIGATGAHRQPCFSDFIHLRRE